jgi:release factor glutamine methyltransferase
VPRSPDADPVVARLRAAGCVFAEDEARLLRDAAASSDELDRLVARRVGGEPLEPLLGWVDFCRLRLHLDPGVFVPRSRTALLAEQAVAALRRVVGRAPVAVDLCCGCGAVAAVLAHAVPGLDLHAADLDPAAVRCARRNLPDAAVHEGDLYAALPVDLRGRVDVLVANAPYVPSEAIGSMPPEARDHEPWDALDGGPDGLDVLRRIVWEASAWLAPDGVVLVESGRTQAPVLADAVRRAGLQAAVVTDDQRGATVVTGAAPSGGSPRACERPVAPSGGSPRACEG